MLDRIEAVVKAKKAKCICPFIFLVLIATSIYLPGTNYHVHLLADLDVVGEDEELGLAVDQVLHVPLQPLKAFRVENLVW